MKLFVVSVLCLCAFFSNDFLASGARLKRGDRSGEADVAQNNENEFRLSFTIKDGRAWSDINSATCDSPVNGKLNLCDTYVIVKVNGEVLHQTKEHDDTSDPIFNETFETGLISKDSTITFEMWDSDAGYSADDLMSTWSGNVDYYYANYLFMGNVTDGDDTHRNTLYITTKLVESSKSDDMQLLFRIREGSAWFDANGDTCDSPVNGKPNLCDTYVVIKIDGKRVFRTVGSKDNTDLPHFFENFETGLISKESNIIIEMWDSDEGYSADDILSTWSGNAEYYLNRGHGSLLKGNITDGTHRNSLFVVTEMIISNQSKADGNDSIEACRPSPCGPNSQCRELRNGVAVCSCLPDFVGIVPNCQPGCVVSSECSPNKACVNQKCVNPCTLDACGQNANCNVVNHNPVCNCPKDMEGDPFTQCKPTKQTTDDEHPVCNPPPCGPNSKCREMNGNPVCSCLEDYIGTPPQCRPECTVNSECPLDRFCMNRKCVDPCIGTCGSNANCNVINHSPICSCSPGYTGDPFSICSPIHERNFDPESPCLPNPCGEFAKCRIVNDYPSCSCLPNYFGSPPNCRAECDINSDCPNNKACIRNICVDPCPGACGVHALCSVTNHLPQCTCPSEMQGNPWILCEPNRLPADDDHPVCKPSPCGSFAQCREMNGRPVCSCLPGYIGNPLTGCRDVRRWSECTINSDCPSNRACMNLKCLDPCIGTCGSNADCNVINHNPICSCSHGYTGDPFSTCYQIKQTETESRSSPQPSQQIMSQFWEKQMELLNVQSKIQQKLLENAEIANEEAKESLKMTIAERQKAEIELKIKERDFSALNNVG